jgi:hypothetical protein
MKSFVERALNISDVFMPCLCLLEKNGNRTKYLALLFIFEVNLAHARALLSCVSYYIVSKACTKKPSTWSITNL